MTADIKYVRTSDGLDIAYQVIGDGPMNLVVVPQIVSHLEYEWEHPSCRDFYTRLGSFARVIRFDKRGAGQSDRIGGNGIPGAGSFTPCVPSGRKIVSATSADVLC